MKKALLFDFDGTLFNSLPAVGGAFLKTLEHYGAGEGLTLCDMRKCIGPPLSYSFSTFFGFDEKRTAEAIEIYRGYHEALLDRYALYDGVRDALEALKDDGFTFAVATSKWEHNARKIIEKGGLLPLFDLVAGGVDGAREGKAAVVRYALDALDIPPERALMIGDRYHDVEGAAECGVKTLGALWGFGTREELIEAGATACVLTPEEMVEFLRENAAY